MKGIKFLRKIVGALVYRTRAVWPDRLYLKIYYWVKLGKKLNLEAPQTYNEKLQWLKLYNRVPLYTLLVDKIEVKKWVAERIGQEHIIPTMGIWDNANDINFNLLPEQFVLKCNHNSGGIYICSDKSKIDFAGLRLQLNKSLNHDYYMDAREWPYKNVKRKILAEQLIECFHELSDYKFFCFNGVPRLLYVTNSRNKDGEELKFDFYDMEFNHLPIKQGHPNLEREIKRPQSFELMKELAAKISAGMPHVRVDFYDVNGHVYFGELTFFSNSGVLAFEPEEWDLELGRYLTLPCITK